MINTENIEVYRITSVTPEVIEATERLTSLLKSDNQATIGDKYLKYIIDSPNTYWLGAGFEENPKIIGMAVLTIMPMITNVRAVLENVVVDESARKQGVGSALCLEAMDIANRHNVNTLRADVSKTNSTSLKMFEKLGFEIKTYLNYLEFDIQQGNRFE